MLKRILSILVLTACASKSTKVNDQEAISNNYEIATWQNFANSAITHSWDDNTPNQTKVALPIYDDFGLKATFFVTIDFKPDWLVFKSAAKNGHEVTSHSIRHSSFKELTASEVEKELKDSKAIIEEHIGHKCYTIAYPFCQQETYNLTPKYYIAARGCSGEIEAKTPKDFMNISAFGCGSESEIKTAKEFNNLAKKALNKNGWATYLFHGIDNDGGYSPIVSDDLIAHLKYLKNNPQDFWVAPFVNVVKYIKEREALKIEDVKSTKELFEIVVSDDLDDTIYNEPITLKKEVYTDWTNVGVTQNGVAVKSAIEHKDGKIYVIFNIVPDAGHIIITKK